MILTADIGNTHCSLARVRGTKIDKFVVLTTGSSSARIRQAIRSLFHGRDGAAGHGRLDEVEGSVVASVVPRATASVSREISEFTGRTPLRFPADCAFGLRVKPKPASQVGADRLAGALGAIELLGLDRDLIVVDVGTAVTVDVVTRGRDFEGGMIAPGPRLGARALTEFTARLPPVEFAPVKAAIGRSTRQAIGAGLWFGFRGLVKGLTEAALLRYPTARIVVAGGDGRACLTGSGLDCRFVPHLTHVGLAAAYRTSVNR